MTQTLVIIKPRCTVYKNTHILYNDYDEERFTEYNNVLAKKNIEISEAIESDIHTLY